MVAAYSSTAALPPRRLRPRLSIEKEEADDPVGRSHLSSNSMSVKQRRSLLLVERYRDGIVKRYVLDGGSKLQTCWKRDGSLENAEQELENSVFSLIPSIFKDFILPAGYPGSVSDDYLEYMLLQFPTNVTGWICHTLVTSSLLKVKMLEVLLFREYIDISEETFQLFNICLNQWAIIDSPSYRGMWTNRLRVTQAVGVGSFAGSTAAASAAAIRWVAKDGLGAIGRLFIGGLFGTLFDDDPKQWRMYADFIGSAGSIFELITPLYPAYFLPLASLGNLAKMPLTLDSYTGYGKGPQRSFLPCDPKSFCHLRESWRGCRKGRSVGSNSSARWPDVWCSCHGHSWSAIIICDVGFYLAECASAASLAPLSVTVCSQVSHSKINLKRARVLVKSHVSNHTVPGYVDCNKEENILCWERFLQPQITFAVSMESMIGSEGTSCMVKALLRLYAKEKYVLFMNQRGSRGIAFYVTFKVGASSLTVLRSLWQAHWLQEHHHQWESNFVFSLLEESLRKLEGGFINFLRLLEEAGWDAGQINLKVPSELLFGEDQFHADTGCS
ncbi:protein root UVB sensitive 5 isoform X3 [Ananas comosus]|uniref:Protein root UVB sensitive 5 isoform X3 n=1 Tax=Ananas comosus TaxID=4615 RepID=A0A6P5G284_ANACO|nr:protein root UVB sensitive 5 isoform X3 [Ananas comosus]